MADQIKKTSPRRRVMTQGKVTSSVPKMAMEDMDPFDMGNSPVQSVLDFASTQGRRGGEITGLGTGPISTSIFNAAVARSRSRYAVITNPYAKRAIDVLVAEVVGSGHKMVSLCPDVKLRKQIELAWSDWLDEVDPSGKLDYSAMEALAFRSMLEGGDAFARMKIVDPDEGMAVPLQVQLFEAEQVPVEKNEFSGENSIIAGIEFDPNGKLMAYHMHQFHPGDFALAIDKSNALTVRVPANEILHLHDVKRPNEVRGLPHLSQVLVLLADLDRYMDAEMVRKKASALIGGFIKRPADGSNLDDPFITDDGQGGDDSEIHIEALEPGTFPILPDGYEVSFSTPADVGTMFGVFLRNQLLRIAAALNVTYDQLTGDMSGVNDRTLRASMLIFKRMAMNMQGSILVHQFHKPLFSKWFEMAVLSGTIKIPSTLTYAQVKSQRWIADPWEYMNPLQEVNTKIMEVRAGFKSRSQVITENGGIPEEVDNAIHDERQRENKLSLIYTTNANTTNNTGAGHNIDPTTFGDVEDENLDDPSDPEDEVENAD